VIGTAIPSLVMLLGGRNSGIRPAIVSALVNLADHGEFVVV
jgi:hypothetical protein